VERQFPQSLTNGSPQRFDFSNQQIAAAVMQIDREKVSASGNPVAAIVRHAGMMRKTVGWDSAAFPTSRAKRGPACERTHRLVGTLRYPTYGEAIVSYPRPTNSIRHSPCPNGSASMAILP